MKELRQDVLWEFIFSQFLEFINPFLLRVFRDAFPFAYKELLQLHTHVPPNYHSGPSLNMIYSEMLS